MSDIGIKVEVVSIGVEAMNCEGVRKAIESAVQQRTNRGWTMLSTTAVDLCVHITFAKRCEI